MKKITLFFALLLSAGMMSCNKNNTTTTPTTPTTTNTTPDNTWTLKGTQYKAALVLIHDKNVLTATDGTPSGSNPQVNSFNVFFKNVPTADGNYKVVFKPQDSLAADEVFLSAGLYATSSTYMPAGIDNITAKVTMVNGKIKFELPDTKVFTTKPSDDTTTLSGVIIEQ